eukprot:COSAG05_NODE_593_length_8488_cov_13.560367_3_plen_77_part_00
MKGGDLGFGNPSQTMLLPHTYAYIVPYFAIHPPMSGYSRPFFTHVYDFMTFKPVVDRILLQFLHYVYWYGCRILYR